jgi:hypothetical protein
LSDLVATTNQESTMPTTSLSSSFIDVDRRVHERLVLIARVLRKFPEPTLPPTLASLILLSHDRPPYTVRVSSHVPDELVVEIRLGLRPDIARIPISWLDLEQSELTSAVRVAYWSHQKEARSRERHQLAQQLEAVTKEIERVTARRDDLIARIAAKG